MKLSLPWWLPLGLLLALAVAIWAGVGQCQGRRAAEAREAKSAEAWGLERDGFQRAAEEAKLKANAEVRELQAALAAKHVETKIVTIVSGTTGPVPVGGSGLAGPPLPQPSGAAQPSTPGSDAAPGAGGCLLTSADQGEIRVSGGAVQSEAGNVVVAGRADAYALPDRHLFGGPLKLNVSIPSAVPAAPRPGLGLGATIIAGPHGTTVGPVVAAPPFRFLWLSWEPQGAFTIGRGGEWSASGTILVRSR